MNVRFFAPVAVLGCVFLASCYPYDESRDRRRQGEQPVQKTVTSADQRPGRDDADQFAFIPNSGFKEFYRGDSIKPRLSVGVGVNWVSPFGPLRIDLAKAILKQEGDDTKLFSFNVGTQF